MTSMKSQVFNTTGNVITTEAGGVIGAYEWAEVEQSDKVVTAALASGALIAQAPEEPTDVPTPEPEVETTPEPQPEATPRPRSRNKNTEPEA